MINIGAIPEFGDENEPEETNIVGDNGSEPEETGNTDDLSEEADNPGEALTEPEETPEDKKKPVERVGRTNRIIDEAMRGKLVNWVLWIWFGTLLLGFGGALYYHDGVYLNPFLAVTAIVGGMGTFYFLPKK